MRTLFWMIAGLFGYRPDYSVPMLDWDEDNRSGVGPNGMILVMPGETLTVDGGLGKVPTLVAQGPAEPNPYVGMTLPKRETIETIPSKGYPPPLGQTTFTLWVEDGGPSFLRVENGNDTSVVYMTNVVEARGAGHVVEPIVTAAVTARGAGLESSDQPVKGVYIVGMRAVAHDELVYDAATGRMYKMRRLPHRQRNIKH